MTIRAIRVLTVSLCLATLAMGATIQTSTSRTAWESGVQNENTTTFDDSIGGYTAPALNNYMDLGTGVFTINGIQFSSFAGGSPWVQYVNHYGGVNDWNSGTILKADISRFGMESEFKVMLPSNTLAFGVDLMMLNLAGAYQIKIDGVNYGTVNTALNPQRVFFGATSDTAMSMVEILTSTNNINPALDNFSIATPGAPSQDPPPSGTPEVQSLLLSATGLIVLSQMRKRLATAKA